ncbi:MAG: SIR2 family protein [Candidatus Hermodarchaeota archaeon]
MDSKILDFIRQRKVTFFVGAGVSVIPPTCLPSWWQINQIVLDNLANESYSLVPEVKQLTSLIKKREEDRKLPPEFVSEIITNRIDSAYFDVLQVLEGDILNQVHLWLATLGKANMISAIITTNFDTLIERAFETVGVPLHVFVDPQDYETINIPENAAKARESPCMLLKLHGTVTRPNTCINTLAQRKHGLHPSILRALNYLSRQTFWVFLGYSGADLEADANYLGIQAQVNDALGFVWLHPPNVTPLPAVASLTELYGSERGIIEFDVLPTWLNDIAKILPLHILPPPAYNLSPETIQKIRAETAMKIALNAYKWASEQGGVKCALILSEIGVKAGYYADSRTVLLKLLEKRHEEKLSSFALGIMYQELGDIASHFDENKDALAYYQEAIVHYQDAKNTEGIFHSLRNLYDVATAIYQTGDLNQAKNYYEQTIRLSELYGQQRLRDSFRLNYASVLFQLENYSTALELYTQTFESSKERRDYLQAGISTYYAGLTHLRMKNQQGAINAIENAISIWQVLEEAPTQLEDAQKLLQSLKDK